MLRVLEVLGVLTVPVLLVLLVLRVLFRDRRRQRREINPADCRALRAREVLAVADVEVRSVRVTTRRTWLAVTVFCTR